MNIFQQVWQVWCSYETLFTMHAYTKSVKYKAKFGIKNSPQIYDNGFYP